MKLTILFIITIFWLLSFSANSQVEIELSNGDIYKGYVFSYTNDSMTIINYKNNKATIATKDIEIQDILYSTVKLKNGENYRGTISKLTKNDIYIRTFNRNEIILKRNDVYKIRNGIGYESYPEIGFSYSFGNYLNLNAGYTFDYLGLRLRAGKYIDDNYYNDIYQAQLDLLYIIQNNDKIASDLGLSYVHIYDNQNNRNYIGFCWDINYYGFFIQAGIGIGLSDRIFYPVLFQVGYIFRFNELFIFL